MESEAEKCIFRGIFDGCVVFLVLYVDDGVIAAKSLEIVNLVIDCLKSSLDITIRDASMFVRFQI